MVAFFWVAMIAGSVPRLVALVPGANSDAMQLAGAVVTAAAGLLAYVGFVKVIERRSIPELAPGGAAAEALAGVALGTTLFAATIGILSAAGAFRVMGVHPWQAALPMFGASVASGIVEELLLRAVVFRIIEEALGTWWSLAISAALFGALHLANPHASPIAALALAFEAGVILAAAYVATRRLWLAMGLHFGWNFTQGGVFGTAVSGHEATGVLRGALSGPAWLSGGEFGAEASVVAVLLCVIAGVALLALGRRRGHIVATPWSHRRAIAAP